MRVFLSILLLALASAAQAGPGRDAFDKFLHELVTLEARFEQSVLDTENARQGLFHGIFQLKRPNRFRWDYVAPEKRQVIADGRDLWLVEDDLQQITQLYQDTVLANTPATLLLSDAPIDEAFEVIELGERLGMQWLELLPRDEDADTLRVLLAFKGDKLLRLELTDKFGQISRFSFFEIKRNPPLADSVFEFVPPEDFDTYRH